jgi:hypothetical protein
MLVRRRVWEGRGMRYFVVICALPGEFGGGVGGVVGAGGG